MITPEVTDPAYLSVRFGAQDTEAAASRLDGLLGQASRSGAIPKRFYADERVRLEYNQLFGLVRQVGLFAILAVLFSAVGVLGLAIALGRSMRKEAAIRKVFGAEDGFIAAIMMTRLLAPLLIGGLLAVPLSLYLAERWLDRFYEAISLGPGYPALSILLVIAVALIAAVVEILRVANTRPASLLRDE